MDILKDLSLFSFEWGFSFSPDPYPFLIALCAFVLSLVVGFVLGPILSSPMPVWWRVVDGLFGWVGRRLDRPSRPASDLALRGFGLSFVVALAAYVAGGYVERLGARMGAHIDTSVVFLSLLLSSGSVFYVIHRARKGLGNKGKEARILSLSALSRAAQTDFSRADDFAVTRAAVLVGVLVFARGLVAPLFWFLIGGLPLACATSALSALSWRFGGPGRTGAFSVMPVWLDRIFGFLPGIFSAVILILAAFLTPTAGGVRAIKGLFSSGGRATFAQGGMPLDVIAWALNVSVGGPFRGEAGLSCSAPWVGPKGASARLDPGHIRRILYLLGVAHVILFGTLMGTGYGF
ncbi:MAG: cobalamin biosynthesis protein [Rhodospirillales bacterium]|nr:cobalamin biosynthesis protein [Rhodospirillales bacterium]